jgi:hypothetical protein
MAAGGEGHRVRERGVVVSCGGSGEKGWRTELDLGRSESLDDYHGTATLGTEPKRAGWQDWGGFRFGLRCYRAECCEAKRQKHSTPSVGQEAEVTNANEPLGEQVE